MGKDKSKKSDKKGPEYDCKKIARDLKDVEIDEVEEWLEAFRMFDRDGDGNVTAKELQSVMNSLGQNPTQKEVKEMIAEVDENDNGLIEFPEFCNLMHGKWKTHAEQLDELKEAFRVFDKDNNGVIDIEELASIMQNLGESLTRSEVEKMMQEADTNKDGVVDYDEFCKMMLR